MERHVGYLLRSHYMIHDTVDKLTSQTQNANKPSCSILEFI